MSAFARTLALHPLRLAALTLLLALAACFTLTAKAAPPGGPMPMMMMEPGHVDRMLDLVGATSEQRSQVKSILDAARTDLRADRGADRTLHEQAMQLFTQPTVDARAAESLRQQMLARHDRASKRMLQAMLDVSRVLSPEQRQQLSQLASQRHGMMGHRPMDGASAARPAN